MKVNSKKKDKLFTMLLDISTNLKESGKYFFDYKIREENHLDVFRLKMKEYEHKGDELVNEIIKDLNNTFITPIEREDALDLAAHMDDILNGLEECSAHFYMYNIYKIDSCMVELSELIYKCIVEIHESVELLSQKKLTDIRQHTVKIKGYEEQCDIIERNAVKVIFERENDFKRLIQYKEIYEILENIADDCQKAAKVLETVIMKNS